MSASMTPPRKHFRNGYREALRRAAQDPTAASRALVAPCAWCGYDGPGYWQVSTHAPTCPFVAVGGVSLRVLFLQGELAEAIAEEPAK